MIASAATFDPTRTYRYSLTRRWAPGGTRACWIMLNPSTADAEQDDPTIRRCIGFSKLWGHSELVVVNLFALRSTDPAALASHGDPIGPHNDFAIEEAGLTSAHVVCAWGRHGALRNRAGTVLRHLMSAGVELHHLGLNDAVNAALGGK